MNNIIIDKRNLLAYKIESGNHYKSIPCTMVCKALALVLELFPEIDRAELEKELDKYI